jgi:release factor glutamine methyltransferase
LEVFGREPTLALDGGTEGLDLIRKLLQQADSCLVSGGLLLLEIEVTQGKSAIQLAHEYFPLANIGLLQDFAGHDRLIRIQT